MLRLLKLLVEQASKRSAMWMWTDTVEVVEADEEGLQSMTGDERRGMMWVDGVDSDAREVNVSDLIASAAPGTAESTCAEWFETEDGGGGSSTLGSVAICTCSLVR